MTKVFKQTVSRSGQTFKPCHLLVYSLISNTCKSTTVNLQQKMRYEKCESCYAILQSDRLSVSYPIIRSNLTIKSPSSKAWSIVSHFGHRLNGLALTTGICVHLHTYNTLHLSGRHVFSPCISAYLKYFKRIYLSPRTRLNASLISIDRFRIFDFSFSGARS